jgi:hypothetical protein
VPWNDPYADTFPGEPFTDTPWDIDAVETACSPPAYRLTRREK